MEPPPTRWHLPDPRHADGDLVGVGADLQPGTILAAYRRGLFPMPVEAPPVVPGRRPRAVLGWWSPDPRGVLPLDRLVVSRSLRRSLRRYEIRVDTAFSDVVAACADPARPHGWITAEIAAAYRRLHDLGWAHSVEAWSVDDGTLAGGLYGVAVGGLFAGESMFHHRRDASKVALVALVDMLREGGAGLLDVQWRTPHLASLGVVEIPRAEYLDRLRLVIEQRSPAAFAPTGVGEAGARRANN